MTGKALRLIAVGTVLISSAFPAQLAQAKASAAMMTPHCDELEPDDPRLITGDCLVSPDPKFPNPDDD